MKKNSTDLLNKLKGRISIVTLVGVMAFGVTVFYFKFYNQGYFAPAGTIEETLCIAAIAMILGCRASLCICITGLIIYPYCLKEETVWKFFVVTKKEIILIGVLIAFSVTSFCLLNRYYGHQYPEVLLKVVGVYVLTAVVSILQTRLLPVQPRGHQ